MFPEVIELVKNPDVEDFKSLVGDYYVAVFGYVQSTFSIVYMVETENGDKTIIKLMTGQKQRGVIKTTTDQMVYQFKPTNNFLEDIEIRLHSENGQFKFYLGRNFTPSATNFTADGSEHEPIIYSTLNEAANAGETFYVTVIPF